MLSLASGVRVCDWVRDSAELFWPIVKEQKKSVLESAVLFVDDTGVLCQENSTRGKKRPAHLWAWIGERREGDEASREQGAMNVRSNAGRHRRASISSKDELQMTGAL